MPNWCENELTILCEPRKGGQIDAILASFAGHNGVEETVFDLNRIIPMPDEYNVGERWYMWRVENWGTKWNASDAKIYQKLFTRARIDFRTAWSPPKPVILKLSQLHPGVRFKLKYWERGMEFQGEYTVLNGAVLKDQESKYHGLRGG